MLRLIAAVGSFLGMLVVPLSAAVVDSIEFTDIPSVSLQSDPLNEVRFFTTSAAQPFTIGAVSWQGVATTGEDPEFVPDPINNPGEAGRYPSFGLDLTVRLTHDQTGNFADFVLGQNGPFGEFGPGPQAFNGSALNLNGSLLAPGDGSTLNGTVVEPGDTFEVEFFEDFDEPSVDPDAFWESITINIEDNYFAPPSDGTIRFDANGFLTVPTQDRGLGSLFYGISYADSEDGLPITHVRLDGHDVQTFWFDLRDEIANNQVGEDGAFRANLLDGVDEPTFYIPGRGSYPGLCRHFRCPGARVPAWGF